jgi:hypothetical protein
MERRLVGEEEGDLIWRNVLYFSSKSLTLACWSGWHGRMQGALAAVVRSWLLTAQVSTWSHLYMYTN